MSALVERPKRKTATTPDVTGLFFGLRQLNGYEWDIVQLTIQNGIITEKKTSPASVKEVTANRLATMMQNGETVDSLA
jgi:hypothetical protein